MQTCIYAQAPDKESLLYRHLQGQANKMLATRAAARKATMTAPQVQAEVTRVHDWFQSALGPWPEKSPLNARVTGTIEGAGVKAEKILFESRPGHTVSAVLYLPNTPPPWPGVIVPCGHSANGKAAETYQRVSILLARSGLAALCYDPIGQGER
ncbi:MAG: metalloendopeptidase, partial [Isosphaeraceae bacterium]